ncbi:MAG: ketopantoate reductase C-terminal domain-containing protein [Tistlia sp.]|uniref:ketopantoate reductase family protein n=1 Tax=Tistlia sp. TaxID=3057121 RepID=UPI0034A10B0A
MPSLVDSPADRPEGAPGVFIVGAGGIGCALGYALLASGLQVTFVEIEERKIDWGNRHGVQVDRRPALPASFVPFETWRVPEGAVVLLCTKCFDNAVVLDRLPTSVILMPIQNGFDPALLPRSSLEGISSFVSECLPDRPHTRITRRGDLHVGRWDANAGVGIPSAVEPLIRAWERFDAFRVKRVADVLPYKYSKLLYNAAISPLAAVAGLDNSQLLTIPEARRLFFRILRENYEILKAAGVPLGVVGPFHPDTVYRILKLPVIAWLMAWPFSLSLRNTYCSMSGEIPKGRTEIDFFNGHLLRLAQSQEARLNRLCVEQVTRMSAERATPDRRWLRQLLDEPRDKTAPAPRSG